MTPRKRGEAVPRPTKKTEYQLVFCSREAVNGWQDCLAAVRNAVVDVFDRLTAHPEVETQRQYRLQGDFATGNYAGVVYERWQYKISDGGRIWYFVDHTKSGSKAGSVLIERAEPGHPKATES